jgi:hypothetical protein
MKREVQKRTVHGKRVLMEFTDHRQKLIDAILEKHARRVGKLWRAKEITQEERDWWRKFDRIIGKLRKDQIKIIGKW